MRGYAIRLKSGHGIPHYYPSDYVWASKVHYTDGSWDYKTTDNWLRSESEVADVKQVTFHADGRVTNGWEN